MKTSNQIRSFNESIIKIRHVAFTRSNYLAPKWTDIFTVIALFLFVIFLPGCSESDDPTGNGNENNT